MLLVCTPDHEIFEFSFASAWAVGPYVNVLIRLEHQLVRNDPCIFISIPFQYYVPKHSGDNDTTSNELTSIRFPRPGSVRCLNTEPTKKH